ncbi:Uma2 family endonuclease [Leptolyngbya sp. FACHB-36]|uniref:Uma2 family endonuclease n=1 Tax=Leptolyngbya sp. FACHB-36 TaxID=2692808 RepID=UPI0016802910|nr:Uma2 family endonuclease [Leptolyngbya sp. FACHB-36]MBD2022138.1 Uma2 family endonuclease [Leptolyngbya sp. FACHB-36]
MTSFTDSTELTAFPDHTQLPASNGAFVKNFQEHPQSLLLTDAIKPVLDRRHPDGHYCIGQDCGIYWRLTDPPERGAEALDWFYVPNVPPMLDGVVRRSYVLWREFIAPLSVVEFASGDGSEERDTTPWTGKFWIYEQVIRPAFYAIYEVSRASVEVYHLVEGQYHRLPVNDRGHWSIAALNVELGIWNGRYQNLELPWLRWWDAQGNLLLIGEERAEHAEAKADQTEQLLQQERQRAQRLAELLRAQGIDPDS